MRKVIDFPYPFAGYSSLDFINCFTSTYMCIEGYDGTEDCYCGGKLAVCDSCGGCKASLGKKQEELFFLFGTMTGSTSSRDSFDGANDMQKALDDTDGLIDFAMKFVGYEYGKVTVSLQDANDAIIKSIDMGKPVLARMKSADRGSFRVINGYDVDGDAPISLICPEPVGAQRKPDSAPALDEIADIYIITGKHAPEVGMKEGFEQIVRVMEFNRANALWDDYISRLNYWDQLADADIDEIKRRIKRVSDTMWHTFNCHNFSETFCRELYHRTGSEALRERFRRINKAYGSTHDRCWQVIAINEARDFSRKYYNEIEWGLCNCITMCLEEIKRNDETVLSLVRECIDILDNKDLTAKVQTAKA